MCKEFQNGAQMGTNILEQTWSLMKKTCPEMISKLGAPKGYNRIEKGSKSKWRPEQVGAGRNLTELGEAYLP